jgi:hypothetical protein
MMEMKIQENKQGEISHLWPALKGTLGRWKIVLNFIILHVHLMSKHEKLCLQEIYYWLCRLHVIGVCIESVNIKPWKSYMCNYVFG